LPNIKVESRFVLRSPLHHGKEKNIIKPLGLPEKAGNNYSPHKTERFTLRYPEGDIIVDLPVVSGNSIRHKLRNLLLVVTLKALGLDFTTLSKVVRDVFTNGGGLDKGDKDKNDKEKNTKEKESESDSKSKNVPLLIRDQETLRALFPMVSLFGTAYGNRMLHGLVQIGIATPLFKENEHTTQKKSNLRYTDDILYYQMATRTETNRDAMKEGDVSQQNIYYYEVASAGIEFAHTISGEGLSDLELSAMQLALEEFKKHAYLGGKTGTGYGQISTDDWYDDLGVSSELYLNWLKENRETILEYLDCWDKPEKIVKSDKKLEWDEKLVVRLDKLVKERQSNLIGKSVMI